MRAPRAPLAGSSGSTRPGSEEASLSVVQTLLDEQAPEFARLPLEVLSNTGSDNTLYRLGTDFVVRFPRFPDADRRLAVELDWLPRLSGLPVPVPEVVYAGGPSGTYPFRWAVLRWLNGIDAWDARHHEGWFAPSLGHDLAAVVNHLRGTPVDHAPIRQPGERGGPLRALEARLRWWLERADGLVDVRKVTRLWDECLVSGDGEVRPVVVHGDLIPGNLLVADARLTAVVDWGALGAGDPAQDLVPAWAVLDSAGAAAFCEDLDVDEPTWLRARGFALEQAIGGVVTYVPRRHPLGEVMQRTLHRLLSRSASAPR